MHPISYLAIKKNATVLKHRIVSIQQPHVGPVVRGKTKNNTEFGNKVDVCLHNGVAYVHRFSWEAYNETVAKPAIAFL